MIMDTLARQARHRRIRRRLSGTAKRPRVSVHRSAKLISVQVVDDAASQTLLSAKSKVEPGKGKVASAEAVGQLVAKEAQAAGITEVVFDRSGYLYHGRVKAVAEGLRAGGLKV